MAYRIDFTHSLAHEVRRIAGRQLAAALDLLKRQPDGPHAAIHDARKRIKRTRALYRLIRPGAKGFADRQNQLLGEIAGQLSHLRDAAALVEASHYLGRHADGAQESDAVARIAIGLETERDRLAGETGPVYTTIAAAVGGLETATRAVSAFELVMDRVKAATHLSKAWAKTDAKARQALASCTTSQDDVPYHDLRKRSQDRWMQAGLLGNLWPSAMAAIRNQAKALTDLLGHEHDLAVLQEKLASSVDDHTSDSDRQAAVRAISRQRRVLQEIARSAAGQLFDKRADRDAAIVKHLIRNT